MNTPPWPWTHQEFLAYVLLYAAHADVDYREEERSYILSRIEYPIYRRIYKEYSQDNGYQQIQKIVAFQKDNPDLTSESILDEIKKLFLADNHFHRMEKLVLTTIRQLLS